MGGGLGLVEGLQAAWIFTCVAPSLWLLRFVVSFHLIDDITHVTDTHIVKERDGGEVCVIRTCGYIDKGEVSNQERHKGRPTRGSHAA
jgi:hypothetical protein